jgi:hypothetical protein
MLVVLKRVTLPIGLWSLRLIYEDLCLLLPHCLAFDATALYFLRAVHNIHLNKAILQR